MRRDRGEGNEDAGVPDTEGFEQLDRPEDEGETGGYTNIIPGEEPIQERLARRRQKSRPMKGPSGEAGRQPSESEFERAAREDVQQQTEATDEDREQQTDAEKDDRQRQMGMSDEVRRKFDRADADRRMLQERQATAVEGQQWERVQQRIMRLLKMEQAKQGAAAARKVVEDRAKALIRNIILNNPWVRTALLAAIGAVLGVIMLFFVSILAAAAVCTWADDIRSTPVVGGVLSDVASWVVQASTDIECPKTAQSPATTNVTGATQ